MTRFLSEHGFSDAEAHSTTIKREHLKGIAAERKPIEYRTIKPYSENRLAGLKPPFHLRLINGMSKEAPEVTVLIKRVVRNRKSGDFELPIGAVLALKNSDIKRERPWS